jgi:CRP/FNR family nitrogen fixation transcriptional regulator
MRNAVLSHLASAQPRADAIAPIARSGRLDEMLALERIGTRLVFSRNQEIFREGERAEYCYKIVSGAVRVCKILADGRRHIASFHFAEDFFGFEGLDERHHTAEAIDEVVLIRYTRASVDRLAEQQPAFGRRLRDMAFANLAEAHGRMLCLGRKTAQERVASFLIEMADRVADREPIELPMTRGDVADYLGLTLETVSRILSAFKRLGAIALPNAHSIDLLDREALENIGVDSAF